MTPKSLTNKILTKIFGKLLTSTLKQIFGKNNGEQQNETEMRWAEDDNKLKKRLLLF